jgi:hypothetical protein
LMRLFLCLLFDKLNTTITSIHTNPQTYYHYDTIRIEITYFTKVTP